jgi:hypothetical protein
MAKKASDNLLDEIGAMEPAEDNPTSWFAKMRKERPEDYRQMIEVVKDYFRGGHTAAVFPSLARLHRYLAGEDPRHKRAPLISVGQTSFVNWARKVQDGAVEA